MTIEEPDPNSASDRNILDLLEDSVPFLPCLLDEPYNNFHWWAESPDITHDLLCSSPPTITTATSTPSATTPTISNHAVPSPNSSSKKRKAPPNQKKNQEAVPHPPPKKNKKGSGGKASGNNCNNGNLKEGRWAEQLLGPCATAITAGNLTRVQHLIYVLHELASPTGDSNHRLAAHGLRALTHHLSSSSSSSSVSQSHLCFSSVDPCFFRKSLLRFYEVSPWFAFPNCIANSSILQILSREDPDRKRSLHILDVGVSHGVQWPTLLEALTRRPTGPPPLVRITVIPGAAGDNKTETPFSIPPYGHNLSPCLLGFAKSMNINLQINRLESQPLQSLNSQVIESHPDETLIVCAQFRLHHLNHSSGTGDERTEFLKKLRDMGPKGVILSENNSECSCSSCGDFATGFSRRVEYLWKFLDSTSSAFKGRESEERRMMEGEAAKVLINKGEMNEGKERWCERMRGVGFLGEGFGEDAIDGGRALLRKYDNNWDMRLDENDGCVGLWWKAQPVSFCSLWKLGFKVDGT